MGRAINGTKNGRREDLGGIYFRSAWEANYARYLNWQVAQNMIKSWEYEPQTFVFHGVTRGALNYKPDFKVINLDDSHEWHEIKGWMDAQSRAKLKRMAKFYPAEKLVVIDGPAYRGIAKWSGLIDGWET